MRLTTRQTVQLHGIIKSNLKATMSEIDAALLNSIAACGDVNRNVMCGANPDQVAAHAAALELARAISDHLTPRTPAYREIWLDGERIAGGEDEVVEPIYGKTYLPRKFKIVVAVPPSNDVDVFAHDLGFIAILDDKGDVAGWNVTVGGGMGMTHGEPDTYPRTADVMGFCATKDAVAIAEAVVTVQRDWGDRANRKHARLKYTIEDRGLDAFRAEVEKRAGVTLAPAQAVHVHLDRRPLRLERRRRRPQPSHAVRAERPARSIAPTPSKCRRCARSRKCHDGEFRITPNQNLIVANIPADKQTEIHWHRARKPGCWRPGRACGAIPWPASRCRPAGWRSPKANAICPICLTRSTSGSPRMGFPPTTSSSA